MTTIYDVLAEALENARVEADLTGYSVTRCDVGIQIDCPHPYSYPASEDNIVLFLSIKNSAASVIGWWIDDQSCLVNEAGKVFNEAYQDEHGNYGTEVPGLKALASEVCLEYTVDKGEVGRLVEGFAISIKRLWEEIEDVEKALIQTSAELFRGYEWDSETESCRKKWEDA